jgi:hypothetical protein
MHQYRIIRLQHLRSDKFASSLHTKNPQLKYNGGPLISNVEIFTIFWGGAWKNQPALVNLSQSINDFFTFIVASPLIDRRRQPRRGSHHRPERERAFSTRARPRGHSRQALRYDQGR